MKAEVTLSNNSPKGGNFTVKVKFKDSFGDEIMLRSNVYIPAYQNNTVHLQEELQPYSQVKPIGVEVDPATYTETVEVTKYKTVTKYRKCSSCDNDCIDRPHVEVAEAQ